MKVVDLLTYGTFQLHRYCVHWCFCYLLTWCILECWSWRGYIFC